VAQGGVGRSGRWRARAAAAGAAALLALLALWPVLTHPFAGIDDHEYVTANPAVRQGLTPAAVRWAFTTFAAANWHPLTWLSHQLDVQLYGLAPAGHHATSLLLHAAAAAALFLALDAMTGSAVPSFVVAALFAVHPLHVESVAWISERKDVLSGLLFALTLGAWARYARRPSVGRYGAAAALLALGLLAKPMLVTTPLVLLLLDVWPLGRVRTAAALARAAVEKLPLLALCGASAAITLAAQSAGHAVAGLDLLPLPARLANAAVSYLRYAARAAWPQGLAVYYPHPGRALSLGLGAAAGVLLLAATVGALRLGRRSPAVPVGWLWFLGMLLPVIGIVQVGDQAMADRYTYLPLIGLFLAAAWGLPAAAPPRARAALGGLAAAAIAACIAASLVQVSHWRDDVALFSRALAVTEGNWTAHQGLGRALEARGDLDGAEAQYRRALAIRPHFTEARYNLGVLLLERGRFAEAAGHLGAVRRIWPLVADARANYGVALAGSGRLEEATDELRAAVAMKPDAASPRYNLGCALLELGRKREAAERFREALRIDPGLTEARRALEKTGEEER
jgi:tetratricopeptide (TPR) repeat protein